MRCPSPLLLLALATPSTAVGGTVTLSQDHWILLQPPDDDPEAPLPGPVARERVVYVEALDDALRVTASWELSAAEPGWYDAKLITGASHVRELRWNGRPLGVELEDGDLAVTGWVDGPVRIELVADLPGDVRRGETALRLAPAVIGRATAGEGLEVATDAGATDGEAQWGGGTTIRLRQAAPVASHDRGTLAVAQVALGLTVGDAEVRAQGRLRWEVRQGELSTVSFDARGVGTDLEVSGASLRSWSRTGDRVTAVLQHPQRQQVDLSLSWSLPTPQGSEASLALPELVPQEVFRSEAAVQLARDGEVDILPHFAGWQATAAASLPDWAEGLVLGTPTTAYMRSGGVQRASVDLLRLELLEQPPVMVDLATATVALTAHGRSLSKVVYQVRNERASHLRVVPPPHSTVLGVRVAGETAIPASDGQPGLLLPLPRSLETVEGLLTFPVEISLLTEDVAWERREEREHPLPTVSAPVAAARTTVYLPTGYRSRGVEGEGGLVADFSSGEGITYGYGVGDTETATADALLQEAVNAWMRNDFDAAQEQLDTLDNLGLLNENAARLQSNLDLVDGRAEAEADSVVARRVREQAKVRAQEDERQAAEITEKAKKAAEAGEYDKAEAYYKQALDIGEDLAKLDQAEQVEQRYANEQLNLQLESLSVQKEAKSKMAAASTPSMSKSRSSFGGFGGGGKGGGGSSGYGSGSGLAIGSTETTTGERDDSGVELQTQMEWEELEIVGYLDTPADEGAEMPEPPEPEPMPEPVAAAAPPPMREAVVKFTTPKPPKRPTVENDVDADEVNFSDDSASFGANLELMGFGTDQLDASSAHGMGDWDDDAPAPRVVVRTGRGGGRGLGGFSSRKDVPPAEPGAPSVEPKPIVDDRPAPEVRAVSVSVAIPAIGEPVRYQRLLLPAGASYTLHISATQPRRTKDDSP